MDNIVIKQPRLYTPLQIGCGSFLGGPIAMVYFLWQNFKTLDNQNGTQYTFAGGILFNVGLLLLLPHLPDNFPGVVIPFVYSLTALSIAATWQLRRDAIAHSVHYRFQPNWRVVLISVTLLIIWLVAAYGLSIWLGYLGIIKL